MKSKIKNYIGITIGLILSFNVGLYAWSGLQAETGDKLSISIWNNITSRIENIYGVGGKVGIGNPTPQYDLDIKNSSRVYSETIDGISFVTTYASGINYSSYFIGAKARGTKAAPTYPKNGDALASFQGRDAVDFNSRPSMTFQATEDFTTTNKGTYIYLSTIPNGSNIPKARLEIGHNGDIGIGRSANAGNTLRYLDVKNDYNGSLAGAILRFITNNTAGNDVTTAHIVKYKGGDFWIANNEPSSSAGIRFHIGGSERLSLLSDGNIGIGTNSPQYKLDVNGQIRGTNLAVTSDQRYKKDIKTIESPLDKISKLRGVTFNWRTGEYKDKNFPTGNQVGFIAQEVEKVIPQIVTTDDKGYKSVQYSNVTAVLVEAVKELKKENEELKLRIEKLETK